MLFLSTLCANRMLFMVESCLHIIIFEIFSYCDSGMVPWLLIVELLSRSKKTLSQLVEEQRKLYPSSGEINFKVAKPLEALEKIRAKFKNSANSEDYIDGVSMEFDDWRFNLRCSNTEPLLRLCIESSHSMELVKTKLDEISYLIET